MTADKQSPRSGERAPTSSFWRSRSGLVMFVFLAVVGLVLVYEHRVHIFTGTGVLIALLALCIGMHFFMHGGHGGHGGNGPHQHADRDPRPDGGSS